MTAPASPLFEQPILNSPCEEPTRHQPLDAEGQPLNEPPRDGRRKSELITPVPKPRKKKRKNAATDQGSRNLQNARRNLWGASGLWICGQRQGVAYIPTGSTTTSKKEFKS